MVDIFPERVHFWDMLLNVSIADMVSVEETCRAWADLIALGFLYLFERHPDVKKVKVFVESGDHRFYNPGFTGWIFLTERRSTATGIRTKWTEWLRFWSGFPVSLVPNANEEVNLDTERHLMRTIRSKAKWCLQPFMVKIAAERAGGIDVGYKFAKRAARHVGHSFHASLRFQQILMIHRFDYDYKEWDAIFRGVLYSGSVYALQVYVNVAKNITGTTESTAYLTRGTVATKYAMAFCQLIDRCRRGGQERPNVDDWIETLQMARRLIFDPPIEQLRFFSETNLGELAGRQTYMTSKSIAEMNRAFLTLPVPTDINAGEQLRQYAAIHLLLKDLWKVPCEK